MAKTQHFLRKEILAARSMVRLILEADMVEAETRRRLERIFVNVLGYDAFKDLSREKAVKGAGDTEHVDFAVRIDDKFHFFVELKRVCAPLTPKHLKQAVRYAIDAGLEWVILTNTAQWQLYHIEFGQPPITSLVMDFDLLQDEIEELEDKMRVLSKKAVRNRSLEKRWELIRSLSAHNLLKAILADDSIKLIRRNIRKETDVLVSVEEVVSGLRKILNEKGLSEMENISVTLSPQAPRRRRRRKSTSPRMPIDTQPGEPDANVDPMQSHTKSPDVSESMGS
jgi:predicted type IV restriction endonuclease